MKKLKLILSIAGVAVIAWIGYRHFFPDEERRIRKMLDGVTEAATIHSELNMLGKVAAASTLAGYFSSDAVIQLAGVGYGAESVDGRDELQRMAIAAFSQVQRLEARIYDVLVTLNPDKTSAEVRLTALAHVDSETDPILQELTMSVRKIEGDWLITNVRTIRTLGL